MNFNTLNSFNIFGTEFTIKFVDKIINPSANNDDKYLFGEMNPIDKTIKISTQSPNGKIIPNSEQEITLYHEIVHAIINTGQYHAYNDDEPFVDYMARAIVQLKKQGIL